MPAAPVMTTVFAAKLIALVSLSWTQPRAASAATAGGAAQNAELGAVRMIEHDRPRGLRERRPELEFRGVGEQRAGDDGGARGALALDHHPRGRAHHLVG